MGTKAEKRAKWRKNAVKHKKICETPERTQRYTIIKVFCFFLPLKTAVSASGEHGGGGGAHHFAAEAEMMAESWPSARFYNPITFNFL